MRDKIFLRGFSCDPITDVPDTNNPIQQPSAQVKTAFENREYDEKYEKWKWDYAFFPLNFLASVFAATGAVFEAGATAFFSLFDVVITSFSVVFVHCGFATNSCSFGTGIYALSLYGNLNDFKWVFLWKGGRKRAGIFEDAGPENKGRVVPPTPYSGVVSGSFWQKPVIWITSGCTKWQIPAHDPEISHYFLI
jgi:hypothetical protein